MQRHEPPILLLVAGNWWPPAARLAAAFIEHGCVVAALCPPGHPLRYVHGIHQIRTLNALMSRRSLEKALQQLRPDLVIPCDDRSVAQLHELHGLHPRLRPLIERSLGEPHGFEVVESRGKLLHVARELGIRIARTHEVTSEAHTAECYARGTPTALLKVDGSSGGEGVQIVRSGPEATAAFRRMKSGNRMALALKRLIINRDPLALWSWSRRRHIDMTLQEFIPGVPANIMVACWQGEVLAELSVQVFCSQGATGASLVVQVIENPQLSSAAALLARHLRMSGFFGLDFILEQGTGAAYLIEMNPRCTQLGHLQLPQGDLAGALYAAFIRRERPRTKTPILEDKIAFFPQALLWGARLALLGRIHHDVPWEQGQLVKALIQEPWPERQWRARLYHLFHRRVPVQAVDTASIHQPVGRTIRDFSPADRRRPERILPARAMTDSTS